ncbi:hypothetical protein PG996_006990 [Apiospora saccharicola]|uniref:Septin-type G domain-containing protein n=1 Tax=Apiospora saccharicola TaxID=335842 RepID=A0ABR1VD71_9PEZI
MSEPPRRSSFGMLLRRSKSGDLGKGGRKQHLKDQQQREAIPKSPPRLPDLYNGAQPPELQSFGGDMRPDSLAIVSGKAEHPHPHSYHPTSQYQQQLRHQYPPSGRTSMDPGRPSMSSVAAPPMPPMPPHQLCRPICADGEHDPSWPLTSCSSILIVGTRGSGKTSFLEFLKTALALPPKKRSQRATEIDEEFVAKGASSGNFIPHYVESEIDGERVGLTLWDSEGLEKNVVDLQLREMSAFMESKFEETFTEEMKVIRSPGVQDTHIHAVFLILDPARLDRNLSAAKSTSAMNGHGGKHADASRLVGGLDEDLDLQVMRILQGKTTIIPVISKADTITTAHMSVLKKTVMASLKKSNMDPLEALGLEADDDTPDSSRIDEGDEDEDEGAYDDKTSNEAESDDGENEDGLPIQGSSSSPNPKRRSTTSGHRNKPSVEESEEVGVIPMSIISPDIYEPGVIGRKFPWGFADPYNEEHCDFTKLKEAVFGDWRGDLRELSREQWYEGWRTNRLKQHNPSVRRR